MAWTALASVHMASEPVLLMVRRVQSLPGLMPPGCEWNYRSETQTAVNVLVKHRPSLVLSIFLVGAEILVSGRRV
jgi:hypothetical protein